MKKMKSLGMVVLLLCFCAIRLSAQTFSGRVVDGKALPVEYATVVILSDSALVKGGITDEEGKFNIPMPEGHRQYGLKISCIGYQTVQKQCVAGDVGTIILFSDNISLGDVVVTGHLPSYKLQEGGLVAQVGNSVLSKVGTAGNILSHIPGVVKKQDGTFEVLGKGTPQIYIDGRLMRDLSELERLGSDEVKQVELLTNPGARYDASVGAVLKIVTTGKKKNGWGVDVRSGMGYAYKMNWDEQVNVNYRHEGWDLFGAFQYKMLHSKETGQTDQTTYVDTLWRQSTASQDLGKTNLYFGKAGFNYEVNKNHSLGATYEVTALPGMKMMNDNYSDVYADGMLYDQWRTVSQSKESSGPTHHLNIYYNGTVGSLNVDLNADAMLGSNREHETVKETSLNYDDSWLDLISKNKNRLYAGKLVLSHSLAGGMISGGPEYSYVYRTDRFTDGGLVLQSTDDKIKEQNMAFFFDYHRVFGRVDASVGLRYEHVNFDFYEDNVYQAEESKVYNNFFPSVSVAVPLGKVNWALSYNVRTRRPFYGQLKSSVHYGNRFTYLSGNPKLQPTYIHSVELRGNYKALQMSVGYNYYKDDMLFSTEQLASDAKISIISFSNFDRRDELVASLVYAPHIGIWKPEWMVASQTQWFDVDYLGKNKSMDGTGFRLAWSNAFELPSGYLFRLDGIYSTKGKRQNNVMGTDGCVNVSLYKAFCGGKLDVLLEGNDLFHTLRDKRKQYSLWTDLERCTKDNTREVKLTLHYHFNMQKSKYKGTGAGQEEMRRF